MIVRDKSSLKAITNLSKRCDIQCREIGNSDESRISYTKYQQLVTSIEWRVCKGLIVEWKQDCDRRVEAYSRQSETPSNKKRRKRFCEVEKSCRPGSWRATQRPCIFIYIQICITQNIAEFDRKNILSDSGFLCVQFLVRSAIERARKLNPRPFSEVTHVSHDWERGMIGWEHAAFWYVHTVYTIWRIRRVLAFVICTKYTTSSSRHSSVLFWF